MRTYTVKSGDTLGRIAKSFYGDASMYKPLAAYNGIINPNVIVVGHRLDIPSKTELLGGPPSVTSETVEEDFGLTPPVGLEQIRKEFGNIHSYISADGTLSSTFESKYLCRTKLPFAIPLSWNPTLKVRNLYCHHKLKEIFPAVFTAIDKAGLKSKVKTYGGCFNFRSKRLGSKLSTHSWGIAIDLNPEQNGMGTTGNMPGGIVRIFKEFGFTWGGDWSGSSKDPMHFQFCSGY
jgi:hypothetical protein